MTPSGALPPTPPIDLTHHHDRHHHQPRRRARPSPGGGSCPPCTAGGRVGDRGQEELKKPRSRTPETFVLNWQGREVRFLEIILDPSPSWQAFCKQNNSTKFFYQRVTIS